MIGNMGNISDEMLEQTLDKKLMSNMRIKKSAHERQANMVTSGEWSSGTEKFGLQLELNEKLIVIFQLFRQQMGG